MANTTFDAAAQSAWSLRETVIVIALGCVFAALYLGWVQVWLALQAIIGPIAMDIVFGLWFVVSIVAAYIIRKPGVAFVSETIAAAVQVMVGHPAGFLLLLSGIFQGAGAEAVFAATRWRNYRLWVLMAAGAGSAVFSFAYMWVRFNYGENEGTLLLAMFTLRVISGMLLGGLLGWIIAEALYKTGVLRGLALDRVKRGIE